jgi:hypothetical protein
MPSPTYLQSILCYFTSMDIAKLRLYLKDEYTYKDTTKKIFLNEVEEVFKDFKNSRDTELLIYNGACNSDGKRCPNCGVKGYRFVGNHSKNYIDLLFEMEGDVITDIYSCSEFKTEVEIDGLSSRSCIYIHLDERVTYHKTPEYGSKVYAATSAYSEIITNPPRQIDFEELSYWVDKHTFSNNFIGNYDIFQLSMKWTPFSKLYADSKEIISYISTHLDEFKQANNSIKQIETEQNLIDWFLKYEAIYEKAPSALRFSFEKEDEKYILDKRNPIKLKGEEFIETLSFIEFYQKHYWDLLDKYSTYTKQEESELYNNQDYKNDEIDIFSLRFHLERRKALEELGINLPLHLRDKDKPEEEMPF